MYESRYKLPPELESLLRSEWETIIEQARFDAVDEGIVRDCLIDRYTQSYAATGIDRTQCTVSRRLPKVIARAREVAIKLKMINTA